MKSTESNLNVNRAISDFSNEGYVLLSVPDLKSVETLNSKLKDQLSEITRQSFNLSDYGKVPLSVEIEQCLTPL